MSSMPLHPFIVHLPLVISLLLPFLILAFALLIKGNKMDPKAWLIIVGLQLATTATGYIALETGETEEDAVEKIVDEHYIHEHEEAAEIFVGFSVVTLVLGVGAFFIRREFQFRLQLLVAVTSILLVWLGYRAGQLGGELVYRHGAARAYTEMAPAGLLPTPDMNTSESEIPVNESLKADESDYGNSTEDVDEELKQED
jgi:uncharacterized membrane protein